MFSIFFLCFLLTNILLLLWVRRFFFVIHFTQCKVRVYIYIYTYTHMDTLLWVLFPFVSLLSLAGVPDYTPRPVLLFSVIWGTVLVGLNDRCLFNCRYYYCSQYFQVNNVHYTSTLIIIMFIIFNTIQC